MPTAIGRIETTLVDRKAKQNLVYYKLEDASGLDGVSWIFVDLSATDFDALERAFTEEAIVIVELFSAQVTPDLEDLPTIMSGMAYVQVRMADKKRY